MFPILHQTLQTKYHLTHKQMWGWRCLLQWSESASFRVHCVYWAHTVRYCFSSVLMQGGRQQTISQLAPKSSFPFLHCVGKGRPYCLPCTLSTCVALQTETGRKDKDWFNVPFLSLSFEGVDMWPLLFLTNFFVTVEKNKLVSYWSRKNNICQACILIFKKLMTLRGRCASIRSQYILPE